MALTAEQQAEIEMQEAREAGRRAHEQAMETLRSQNNLAAIEAQANGQAALVAKQSKLELVRLAKETLIENRRTQPAASAVDIAPADIIAFASALEAHVNA
jgi:hypothetical protein